MKYEFSANDPNGKLLIGEVESTHIIDATELANSVAKLHGPFTLRQVQEQREAGLDAVKDLIVLEGDVDLRRLPDGL